MELKVTYRAIGSIFPDPQNTRTHPDEQIEQIAGSILEFGFTNPVLITPDGQIIAGEGRWLGGQRAGIKKIPCIILAGLSDRQRRAYVIADNKIAQNSGWNWDKLQSEISALVQDEFNIDALGFTDDEITGILEANIGILPKVPTRPAKRNEPETAPVARTGNSKIIHTCPNCGNEFN